MADQRPPRRRFQFRLRTLMLLVTLAAVACWGVMDRQRLIRERDDALLRATKAEGQARETAQLFNMEEQVQRQLLARIKDMAERLQAAPHYPSPSTQP
jgi:hypothetical protein